MRREEIVKKMFETAVREKFGHLKRIHSPEAVFQTWAQLVKEDMPADHFQRNLWRPETTIGEALESLDILFDEVMERMKDFE